MRLTVVFASSSLADGCVAVPSEVACDVSLGWALAVGANASGRLAVEGEAWIDGAAEAVKGLPVLCCPDFAQAFSKREEARIKRGNTMIL